MSNLLDKASIILTPTAYNNGEALCVKPSDGSGDFDFSRNSAATRVNAQGLVENVQILSSNLVQNGDFSEEGAEEVSNGSFSQEGAELVTNGSFDTDTDWTKGTGWSISGGSANCDGVSSNSSLYQNVGGVNNTIYKITGTISNYVSGTLQVGGSSNFLAVNSNGDFVHYRQWTSDSTLYLKSVNFIGSINNVSVREVGQDWTLGTGWSISDGVANYDGLQAYQQLRQGTVNGVIGKNYLVKYTVSDNNGVGGIQVKFGGVNLSSYNSSNGSFEFYVQAISTDYIRLTPELDFNGSITNISVKEVGQNWNLFSGWSIGNNKVIGDGTAFSNIQQTPILIQNKKVKLTFDILDYVSGTFRLIPADRQDGLDERYSGNGSYEVIYTSTVPYIRLQQQVFNGSITNISVIEITDDTNLPRINYEGFSYQDALGSELVINGNDTSNIVGLADNQNTTIQTSFLTIGKTYKIDFEIYDYVEGSIFLLRPNDLGVGSAVSANGNYTYTVVADASTSLIFRTDGLSTTLKLRGISVKEYLGQEVVPDSGCGSWLWEPQSTNLITYSEDFSQWSVIGTPTITSNYGISPDGTQNSTRIQFNNSDRIYEGVSVSGDITYSVYLKGVGQVRLRDNDGSNTKDITLTSEWIRYEFTFNDTITNVQIQQSVGTSDLEIWGAQVEALSYPTSLIPTEGSTVTRNQDVCTNGGSLASINSTSGTLYAEIAALANDGTSRRITLLESLYDKVSLVLSPTSNSIQGLVLSGGSVQFNQTFSISNTLDFNKIAFKYKTNDFAIWVNGVEVATDTSGNTPIGLSELSFADGDNTSNKFFGKTKALAVWKEALSDQELAELTTI